uniref:Uncharacterized protein n=1 Tax=Rhizophora mucronata TaxID=61149 RepID=A0A2P2PU71_RHIMU
MSNSLSITKLLFFWLKVKNLDIADPHKLV